MQKSLYYWFFPRFLPSSLRAYNFTFPQTSRVYFSLFTKSGQVILISNPNFEIFPKKNNIKHFQYCSIVVAQNLNSRFNCCNIQVSKYKFIIIILLNPIKKILQKLNIRLRTPILQYSIIAKSKFPNINSTLILNIVIYQYWNTIGLFCLKLSYPNIYPRFAI